MYRSTDFLLISIKRAAVNYDSSPFFNERFFTFVHNSLESLLHVNFVKIIKNLLSRQFV